MKARRLKYKSVFGIAVVIATTTFALALTTAQTSVPGTTAPKFDSSSVKPNKPVDGVAGRNNLGQKGGYLRITGHSLRMLMGIAFGLPNLSDANRIVGLPGWADSESFDIEAR